MTLENDQQLTFHLSLSVEFQFKFWNQVVRLRWVILCSANDVLRDWRDLCWSCIVSFRIMQ